MNAWLAASIAILPAFALPLWVAARGAVAHRLMAVELLAVIASLLLVALSFAFEQPSFIDVALALTLLSLPGTLLLAAFLERWL